MNRESHLNLKRAAPGNSPDVIGKPTNNIGEDQSDSNSGFLSATTNKRLRTTLTPILTSDANYHLKFSYGINAWRHWVQQKVGNDGNKSSQHHLHLYTDLLNMEDDDLDIALSQFVREVRKPNNECYVADSIFYLCLGKCIYRGLYFNIWLLVIIY